MKVYYLQMFAGVIQYLCFLNRLRGDIIQLVPEWWTLFNGSVGVIVTAAVTILLFWLSRKREKKKRDEAYAAVWCSVMLELWHGIDRIERNAQLLLSTPSQISSYEIEIVDGVSSSFLTQSRNPEVTKRVYEMYNNILHFKRCYHDYIQKPNLLSFNGAAAIAIERHAKMREQFHDCLTMFNDFCDSEDLKVGRQTMQLPLRSLREFKLPSKIETISEETQKELNTLVDPLEMEDKSATNNPS